MSLERFGNVQVDFVQQPCHRKMKLALPPAKRKTLSDYFSSSVQRKQSTEDTDVPKEVTCNEEIKTAHPSNEQAVQDKTQEEESCAEVEPRPSLIEKPYQPKNFPFPKKTYGKERRSFQSGWFVDFPCLHYDEDLDSVHCYICINQNAKETLKNTARNMDPAFISKGYSNWKNAHDSFKKHQVSECHSVAVDLKIVIPKTHNDVLEITNEATKKSREDNRRWFAKIIECLQYLARQGLAIRSEDDEESNFIQLLKLRAKDDLCLARLLDSKGDKYTSHEVQNELLGIMANHLTRDLVSDIRSNYYSIICDEYTDISSKEQLTFCLRWIDEQFEAHEDFIGFYHIRDIKSDTICMAIKDILLRLQLSLADCRGKCYDGANNMLGSKSGVAQQILALQPKALATHCHGHSLSLSVKDTVRNCKLLSDTMDTAKEIVPLIKYSPKRENILGEVKENIEQQDENSDAETSTGGILQLCTTR